MVQLSKNETKRKRAKLQPRESKVFTGLKESLTKRIYESKDSTLLRGY